MSSNTVTEKINFTSSNEIERALPTLLADNAKMSVQIWNHFCDKIDDIVKPLGRVSCLSCTMWTLLIVFCSTYSWIHTLPAAVTEHILYGLISPVVFLLFVLLCKLESYINKKVASGISKACASASNHDKDLTMSLVGNDPKQWYIEVALRNFIDVENNIESQEIATPAAAQAVPVATAFPVVAPPVVTASPVAASPVVSPVASPAPVSPPKKYIKDEAGKLTLNPEYKKWKESN